MLICTEGIGISLRGGGACKSKNFKAMYEAKLELSEWVGTMLKKSSGGKDIFWDYTMQTVLGNNFCASKQSVESHGSYLY